MNTTKKDILSLWRSPLLWLVLALITFISAWLMWQMLDRYIGLQTQFLALPIPPTINQALWAPYMMILAKMLLLVIALTTAKSFAQEQSEKTIWYLLINHSSYGQLIWNKFKAQSLLLLFVWFQMAVIALLLNTGGDFNWLQSLVGLLGLTLFTLWFISLGLLVSSYCQSTGTSVLLSLVVFVLLFIIGGDGVGQEFGLNWLKLISPVHHLKWFAEGVIAPSSVFYLGGGILILLYLTAHNVDRLRASN